MDSLPAPSNWRRYLAFRPLWLVGLVTIFGSVMALAIEAQFRRSEVKTITAKVITEFPHDPTAFTQGLVVVDGQMYEGTGKKGESTLRKVDLKTGRVELFVPLEPDLFGEGITVLGDKIYQLTWQNRIGLVYDLKTLRPAKTFRYSGEGWGLTHDGKRLILSDGTALLRFIDPQTFEVVKRLRVTSSNGPVDKLNELEFVKGEIFANIWYQDRIARISPESGEIVGWIDLAAIYPARRRASKEEVLNGIAYDENSGRLFVTGKNWPKVYEIELAPDR